MPGFGPRQASRRRRNGAIVPPPPTLLGALSLAVPTIGENSAPGSLIGAILGRTAGSTLSLPVDAGGRFAIGGTNLIAGLVATNFEAATSHSITIRETLAGTTNTPRDTVLNVGVSNVFEAASLSPLSLSATIYTIGAPSSGSVTGATAGSTIVASGLPAGLTVNGAARTWAWSGTGSAAGSTIVLTETLADSANSPRVSNVGVTIATSPYMTVPNYATLAAFGDSITAGQSAAVTANRWTNRLATALGATLTNKGTSGTVLQNSNDSGGSPRANNGRDRFIADLTGANLKAAVFIAYGFNDARYVAAPATFNVASYLADYREILNGLIVLGYARADVYLGAPYYVTDTGLVTGTTGFSGQTRAAYEAFVAAAAAVAAEYGVNYCDLYAELNTPAFIAEVDGNDNTHPLDTGHGSIATAWQTRTFAGTALNARAAPSSVTPTGGVLQIAADCATVSGATSYEFVPMLSYVDGATTTDSDGSGAVMTLAAGSYRIKARAVFGDGTRSPWVFAASDVTVSAAADTAAPTLSSPTDAANGSSGGTLSVSTDEGNGTLYWFVSISGTPPSAADLKTGTGAVSFGSQSVSGTGVQNVSASGLTASTAYFAHFLHTDAAANDSTIASGDGFTTAAGGTIAVFDTFTDPAGTALSAHLPDIGGAWSAQPGVPTNPAPLISAAGRLYTTGAAGIWQNANGPASADHYAQADFHKLSTVTNNTVGLAVRMSTSVATFYFGRYSEASGGLIQIWKAISGTFTQLASVAHTWSVGVTKTMRMEVSGSTDPVLVVMIDGATVLTVTDNSGTRITANGKCGPRHLVAVTSTTGIHMDNFEAGS